MMREREGTINIKRNIKMVLWYVGIKRKREKARRRWEQGAIKKISKQKAEIRTRWVATIRALEEWKRMEGTSGMVSGRTRRSSKETYKEARKWKRRDMQEQGELGR